MTHSFRANEGLFFVRYAALLVSVCLTFSVALFGCSSSSRSSSEVGAPDASSQDGAAAPDRASEPPNAPSCAGELVCNGESCCTSPVVTGGAYSRTYTNDGTGAKDLADPATVSDFRLDKYDVTVGRFRQFVSAWNGGSGWVPAAGSGKHTHLNGGKGLANSGAAGTYEPGWRAPTDNAQITPTGANLGSCDTYSTWTDTPATHESLPINCVNWYEAYAFCIWDGGFLPSSAEWEYAAAGGSEQRQYPWGSAEPVTTNQYAIYGCNYPSTSDCADVTKVAPAGTAKLGAGRWGQLDLAGNMWQWNLDTTFYPYPGACTDCAFTDIITFRVTHGGAFFLSSTSLQPTVRGSLEPGNRIYYVGLRCARSP